MLDINSGRSSKSKGARVHMIDLEIIVDPTIRGYA